LKSLLLLTLVSDESTGEDAVPDPKFNDELHDLIEGEAGKARVREPSAREREKRRKAGRPGRRHRGSAWGIAVLVLIGAVVFAYVRLGSPSTASSGGANDTRLVTNGSVPSTSSVTPLNSAGPPADPFQGTPADKWADGAAGIVIPAAEAAGQYSATQVESAYQTTKQMIIAATLDKQSLLGGAPSTFANLLTPQQRTQFDGQLNKSGLNKEGEALSSRAWILQFAPGTAKLVSSVMKVYGTMSAHAGTDSHGEPVLNIDVNYRIVYAVEPPKAPVDWMRIVAQLQQNVEFGDWADADSSFTPWWSVGIGVAGARCGMGDGFVHPDYPSGPPQSVQPSGAPINPYSLKSMPSAGCQNTTGT
jgi:hypothetical protein